MCYAIPGEIIGIKDKIISVDYFGEKKSARNEFFPFLSVGDYIYAQGGFVVQKIKKEEALSILDTWRELFSVLKEKDLNLARDPKDMRQIANSTRQKRLGNSCCVHGIINFSNYCKNNCAYCGIRKDNSQVRRYRMAPEEIIESSSYAVNKLGFKALVFQSGEDSWYTYDILSDIVKRVREKCAALLVVSIGERDLETYKRLYDEGAKGVLLRFETSREDLYKKLKPESDLKKRLQLIDGLKKIGYLVMTGFLVGIPGQSEEDIISDIKLTGTLGVEMFSFGPFIPHKETPLAESPGPSLEAALNAIARARIMYPESKILVTTSLETLDKENGAKKGLMSGGNSLMIDLTPKIYQNLYDIYPGRKGTESTPEERIEEVLKLLESIGRAPVDIGL